MYYRSPSFWWKRKRSFFAYCLLFFSIFWRIGSWLKKVLSCRKRISLPVLCVGNIVVGGSGKTPTALAIASILKRHGKRACFLTRGYGGKEKGPLLVDLERHTFQDVGDEALILARQAPTIVSTDRYHGACMAESLGIDIIIMDDGFQNHDLVKDFSFLVFYGPKGWGNGCVLPAGPLRSSLGSAFQEADGLIVIGKDSYSIAADAGADHCVLSAFLEPYDCDVLRDQKVIAFAGIGHPEKFFETLAGMGICFIKKVAFPDHYFYKRDDLDSLMQEANSKEAILVTTEKDWVRLPLYFQKQVHILKVKLLWEDEKRITQLLMEIMEGKQ